MSAWISVKERLPETARPVMCFNGEYVAIGWRRIGNDDGWFHDCSYDRLPGVTHWQPLPEPPESE